MGELLFWVGEDKMLFRQRLRHLGQVAGRGLHGLGVRTMTLTDTRG
jgi:hypothetical protein